jgi:hypothetical protein
MPVSFMSRAVGRESDSLAGGDASQPPLVWDRPSTVPTAVCNSSWFVTATRRLTFPG